MENLKVPPQNIDAEQAVIGSMLLDNSCIEEIIDLITEKDFYNTAHQKIFKKIIEYYNRKEPADLITISGSLTKEQLENIGGIVYLSGLVDNIPSVANVKQYAVMVRETAVARELITISRETIERCFDTNLDISEIIEKAQQGFMAVSPILNKNTLQTAGQVARKTINEIEERHNSGHGLIGISSGLPDLDNVTGGHVAGEVTIIAGRPGTGKSALAGNIIFNAARNGEACLFHSLEMPNEAVMNRLFAGMTEIEARQLRKGYVSNSDWPRLVNAAAEVAELPLYFDDTPVITPQELRVKVRRAKKDFDIKLLVLDYMQLMSTVTIRGRSREQEIAEVSRTMKAIARETNIAVIALSQLNRELEKRPNKRPIMSDLRESGAIEQDAELILFLYRDEIYNQEEDNPEKGVAEIIIGKNRHGICPATVKTVFKDKYQTFKPLARYGNE